ncbi:intraflagellar transport protein 81 [Trichonephila inaurata madagascariensis]|uniref:Intraflagellar transport protein 81 n=1 Tax=Trichonephila inaurata madagascariensis TaxID=2747483 RepID=A0A8X6Y4Z3_9ARAC|nr:intraflagellar transport protein 81 [Trichonephila inaurata madagascariensis]
MDLSDFRQGLVTGEKSVIYHILEWILRRTPELKKRAYLAQFLMKIELPPDIEGDVDIMELYEQVESHPNVEAMLSVAKNLREERDLSENLNRQKMEQRNAVS